MALLADLKVVCGGHLRCDVTEFTVGSTDLFLIAANNARKQAELMHDFEYARVLATLVLAAAGTLVSSATIVEGVATGGVKSIVAIRRIGSTGAFYPLDFTRSDIALERDRSELELTDAVSFNTRYPGDYYYGGSNVCVIQRGGTLLAYPNFTALTQDPLKTVDTLYLEGYGWLPDYASTAAPNDFILTHGFAYMQWATITELNMLKQTFVPRQEGNIGSTEVEKRKTDAFQQLVLWDSYLLDASLIRSA